MITNRLGVAPATRLRSRWKFGLAMFCGLLLGGAAFDFVAADERIPDRIQFNRDVRPILADRCFACHGPDKNKRKADLRLDQQAGLLGSGDSAGVVKPQTLSDSELWRRVMLPADSDERMPPAEFGKELSDRDKEVLKRWIEQGAVWEGHWAFQQLTHPALPAIPPLTAPPHPIDAFVLARLQAERLTAALEADRVTLIRRLSFDLTGLPPTPAEVADFVRNSDSRAYEKLVDRLLASARFGERMAVWWLDLVRYADSVGYHGDQPMSVYPYREYVIKSFQSNKPFNQFTIEQLGGDLIPEPSTEHQIAAGYNRLGMMSAEGGVQPKEYLAKYIAERVRNLSGTWLGVTMGCCECHDHKYDPFTTRDFYSMEAFFADIEERGLYSGAESNGKWGPSLELPTPEQRSKREQLKRDLDAAQQQFDAPNAELEAAQLTWEQTPPTDGLPEPVRGALAVSRAERTAEQLAVVTKHFRSIAPQLAPVREILVKLRAEQASLEASIPSTLVTKTVMPRTIRILARGNWMDESGAEVSPRVPEILPAIAPAERRLTRLDLARWLVSSDQPLTSRVFVNRIWKLLFGAGLSRKLDDLGAQGEWPSHPELLDHLASQFVDSDWNVKALIKYIVMSNTYRQASTVGESARQLDPLNRWLSHQSRFRLDAEFVRDNALAVSGLLVERVGGPSVKPFQPPGYWSYLNFPTREWENGHGHELYRRGLYTHWQRQYLHPALLAFDAPCREECTAERPRSNTPLQSLVLLNDPCYVEAAREFARGCLHESPANFAGRLNWLYQRAVSRSPSEQEQAVLKQLYDTHLAQYQQDTGAASELAKAGERVARTDVDWVELAAWTSVTRTILNLHETITRN